MSLLRRLFPVSGQSDEPRIMTTYPKSTGELDFELCEDLALVRMAIGMASGNFRIHRTADSGIEIFSVRVSVSSVPLWPVRGQEHVSAVGAVHPRAEAAQDFIRD